MGEEVPEMGTGEEVSEWERKRQRWGLGRKCRSGRGSARDGDWGGSVGVGEEASEMGTGEEVSEWERKCQNRIREGMQGRKRDCRSW